ncbi:transporter substrate-binding domain-containing protein [Idiomarina sp.]|uniref:transporter substrate-binding domain-containing protein n=1 Tax=Idiomarina sp. TaxID=1874361 RepID=UPI001D510D64|nr:transporter substrate-binding domain-containing protein [Idiomarina sp.]MCJ8317336.1 transporter substrate-binding domain-containing protein [Idiomarina sp.]NQZ16950.1 transporter substrate-binding domain-containing protein [Idiomarina sp.]
MSRLSTLTLTAVLSLSFLAFSHAEDIGLATGYPPYQFSENGDIVGFDVDVTKAVFNYLNKEYTLHQHDWDNVVSLLRFGELDMAMGMEQTTIRQQYFDFSSPYYNRVTTLFVL